MTFKVRWMFMFFLYSCLLFLSYLPLTRAGSFAISPVTVYGTTITFSGSYPDAFRFHESTNISLAISVTFNNESISAVNITAIHVRLYDTSVNLTQMTGYPSPTLQHAYFYGNWLSTDYYPEYWNTSSAPPPHKIERASAEVTTGSWAVDLVVRTQSSRNQEVQAKLYVQVTLVFLDINGEAIWRHSVIPFQSGYHWYLFSGEGEAPYVTIYPQTTQQFWLFRPEILAILVGSIGLVLVGIAVIRMRRKRVQNPRNGSYRCETMKIELLILTLVTVFLILSSSMVYARQEKWLTTNTLNLRNLEPDFEASDAPSPNSVDASFVIYGDLVKPESSLNILREKDHVVIKFKMVCKIPPDSPYDFALSWSGLQLWIYNATYGRPIWTSLDTSDLNLPKGNNVLNLGTCDLEMDKSLFEYYNVIPSDWHYFDVNFGFSVGILVGKLTTEAFHLYFTYNIDLKELGLTRSLTFEQFGLVPQENASWIFTDRGLMFVFIITTIIFIVTTAYFARKARKFRLLQRSSSGSSSTKQENT